MNSAPSMKPMGAAPLSPRQLTDRASNFYDQLKLNCSPEADNEVARDTATQLET